MTAHMKFPPQPFPSRLRLRFPQLRRAPLACADLAASLRAIPGTHSVEASAATGSVLVIYQVHADAEQAFLAQVRQALASQGLSCDHAPATTGQAGGGAPAGSVFDGVAEKFVGAVVDKLVERSALGLLAALL
jgi:hypothetical protein